MEGRGDKESISTTCRGDDVPYKKTVKVWW